MSDPIPPHPAPPVSADQALTNAHETIARLNLRVTELEKEIGDMAGVARRQKRNARQNDTALRNDLAVARNRRG